MPIRYEAGLAVIEGHATVEEAGDLAAWLIAAGPRAVDLAGCSGMHAAVLQCLMALAPQVVAPPRSEALACRLAPVIALPEAAPGPPPKPARRRRKAPASRRSAARAAVSA